MESETVDTDNHTKTRPKINIPISGQYVKYLGEVKTEQGDISWTRSGGFSSIFNDRLHYVFNDVTTYSGQGLKYCDLAGHAQVSVAFCKNPDDKTLCIYPALEYSNKNRARIAPTILSLDASEVRYNDTEAKVGTANRVTVHGDGRLLLKALGPIIGIPECAGDGFFYYSKAKKGTAGSPEEHLGIGIVEVKFNLHGICQSNRLGELFGPSDISWGSVAIMVYQDHIYLYGHEYRMGLKTTNIFLARTPLFGGGYRQVEIYEYWDGQQFSTMNQLLQEDKSYVPVMWNIQSGTIFHSTDFSGFNMGGGFVFVGSRETEDSMIRVSFSNRPWGPFVNEATIVDLRPYGEQQKNTRHVKAGPRKNVIAHPCVSDLKNGELFISWTEPFPTQVHLAQVFFSLNSDIEHLLGGDFKRPSISNERPWALGPKPHERSGTIPQIRASIPRQPPDGNIQLQRAANEPLAYANDPWIPSLLEKRRGRDCQMFISICPSGPVRGRREGLTAVHYQIQCLGDEVEIEAALQDQVNRWNHDTYMSLYSLWKEQERQGRLVATLDPDWVECHLKFITDLKQMERQQMTKFIIEQDLSRAEVEEEIREEVFERIENHMRAIRAGWSVSKETLPTDHDSLTLSPPPSPGTPPRPPSPQLNQFPIPYQVPELESYEEEEPATPPRTSRKRGGRSNGDLRRAFLEKCPEWAPLLDSPPPASPRHRPSIRQLSQASAPTARPVSTTRTSFPLGELPQSVPARTTSATERPRRRRQPRRMPEGWSHLSGPEVQSRQHFPATAVPLSGGGDELFWREEEGDGEQGEGEKKEEKRKGGLKGSMKKMLKKLSGG